MSHAVAARALARFFAPHRLALAVAALASSWAPAAHAVVVVAGTGFTQPGTVPGNDLLWVGSGVGTTGAIDVNGGSAATYGALNLAWSRANGSGLIDGAGSTLTLNTNGGRLGVGMWGTADLTVRNGAKILADGNAASCNGGCGGSIGAFAGTTASLLLMGAGTEVRLRDSLNLAQGGVDTTQGFGTVGGHTHASLDIEDGARLVTGGAFTGAFNNNRLTETSTARINIYGANALWEMNPGSHNTVANRGPGFTLGSSVTNQSFMTIAAGGELRFNGSGNVFSTLNMGSNGGRAELTVTGAGSKVQFNGESAVMQVARSAGSQAQATVNSGGVIQGLYYLSVGRDGGNGTMQIDGAGSRVTLNNTATAAANGTANVAIADVGRAANSVGNFTISNGGRLEVLATTARSNSPSLNVGRDGGTGTLNITGAGSVAQLSAASVLAGGGAGEAINPTVTVGRLGTGTLNVTAGGKLLLQGNAVSNTTASRSTVFNVGGFAESNSGGTGTVLVSGLGSEVALSGSDAFISVGRGAGSTGTLTVADQAVVRGTVMAVGRSGGVGTVHLNGGSVYLSGQQTGNSLSGAVLALGTGGSNGVMTMGNNALLRVDNASGTASSGVTIGGSSGFAGGSGVLTMSSGSRIEVNGPAGISGMTVGRDGSGVLSMSASHVDVGATGALILARSPGSTGTMTMTDGSTLNAQYVGVGRERLLDGTTKDGGVASLVINSGSTVTAGTLEIGIAGYLGGVGTIVGNVINHGVFNPGNSPGTMVINGSYTAGLDGKLILEVGLDSSGNFITDQVIFTQGTLLDLAHLDVEFKFLGAADPVAFNNSGAFDIDSFLKQQVADGNGGFTLQGLDDQQLAGATYAAVADSYQISNFSFSAAGGANNFTATPVPEPGTWLMLMCGLLAVAGTARRQSGNP